MTTSSLLPLSSWLDSRLSVTASAASTALDSPHSSLAASSAYANSIAFELTEAERRRKDAQRNRERMQENVEWLHWCVKRLSESRQQFAAVADEIAALQSVPKASATVSDPLPRQNANGGEKKAAAHQGKKKAAAPAAPTNFHLTYPTVPDFDRVPKYMKGRLQYAQLRTAIDEFNAALTAKYAFLQLGFSNIKSLQDKKKYKALKSQESSETKGHVFVVADDLKNCPSLKYESSRRTVFNVLRHTKRTTEIRGPGNIVRYAIPVVHK